MGSSKRIYNKFEFWSVADCDCSLCQFYSTKNKTCTLDVCCIEDIKKDAIRREQAVTVQMRGRIVNATNSMSDQMSGTALSGEGGAA